jgi:hypothetical protein
MPFPMGQKCISEFPRAVYKYSYETSDNKKRALLVNTSVACVVGPSVNWLFNYFFLLKLFLII